MTRFAAVPGLVGVGVLMAVAAPAAGQPFVPGPDDVVVIDTGFEDEPDIFSGFFFFRDEDRGNLFVDAFTTTVFDPGLDEDNVVLEVVQAIDPVDEDDPLFDDLGDTLESFVDFPSVSYDPAVSGPVGQIFMSVDAELVQTSDFDAAVLFSVFGEAFGVGFFIGFVSVEDNGPTTFTLELIPEDLGLEADDELTFSFGFETATSSDFESNETIIQADNFLVIVTPEEAGFAGCNAADTEQDGDNDILDVLELLNSFDPADPDCTGPSGIVPCNAADTEQDGDNDILDVLELLNAFDPSDPACVGS